MLSVTEIWYRAKKAYALYPGVVSPVSGSFLADHYARRQRERNMARVVLDALVGTAFKLWIPLRAWQVERRLRLGAEWRSRAIRIALARFADPNDIALFRIRDAQELDGYIRRFEDAALNKRLNPVGWTMACVLTDKIRFYERCLAHGLPHPRVVATWRDGACRVVASDTDRPLLLKPARGEGGRGVRGVRPLARGEPAQVHGALLREFQGCKGPWLIQERIFPHPDLEQLALGALTTARITTIVNEEGEPEVASAVLRFASDPGVIVDNMKAGGLLSPIDLDSGLLGTACQGYGGGDHDVHPVTGAAIRGHLLPDWPRAKALAIEAHRRAFSEYALIGWDVGLAPDGPILIEGNAKPGVLMPQRAGRAGLGGQRYGALIALQLERNRSGAHPT